MATTRTNQGPSLLAHGNDWPGRAIAAEARVIALEEELRGEREAYDSLHCDVQWEHQEREEELEEDVRVYREVYDQLINFIVLHEFILREYYDERQAELPKEKFEATMHKLHTALILRTLDNARDAADVDTGE